MNGNDLRGIASHRTQGYSARTTAVFPQHAVHKLFFNIYAPYPFPVEELILERVGVIAHGLALRLLRMSNR